MAFLLAATGLHAAPTPPAYVNYEGKQTSPVRLSADGTRLFVVNTPDARLSVFDVTLPSNPVLIAEIPVGIEPVSVHPRTADEVWVVNEVSDSVSIVSVSQRVVTDTLYVPDEPADVVFAGGRAFVTSGRKNEVVVFDAVTHAQLAAIPLKGINPRAIATSLDGTKVYAALALSGNRTTMIPLEDAPAQPKPVNTSLPNPPRVPLIVDANDPNWAHIIKFKMPDNDVAEIDVAGLNIVRYFTNVGTINLGLAVRPDNGDLYVANTDARNLVRFETALRSHVVENRVTKIDVTTGVPTFYNLNPGVDHNVLPNPAALATALAQPTGIVFDPTGNFFYVAAFGTDRVARIDKDGNILARIEISDAVGAVADARNKRGPRGLALNAGAQRLYVANRISNTLTLVDTTSHTVLKEIPIGSHDPTPEVIRVGRGFLYDAKLSGNGNASCATCHVDAEMDLLAWDLGDPTGSLVTVRGRGTNPPIGSFAIPVHPMKGPLVTQTFRGLKGNEPFHWRADRTNFVEFKTTFNTLLGGATLADADMKAFSDFIDTVITQPNPHQNLDRSFSTSVAGGDAVEGKLLFEGKVTGHCGRCIDCHTSGPGTGTTNGIFVGGMAGVGPQVFKLPHLRNLYQKVGADRAEGAESLSGFGFLHDGREGTMDAFLSREFFGPNLTPQIRKDLTAFMLSFDNGTAPAVGHMRAVTPGNVSVTSVIDSVALLEKQAFSNSIDLVVKGKIDGKRHGLVYQPGTDNYRLDVSGAPAFTRAELLAKIESGDRLNFMGVPPGSGVRMGIDRDLDGTLDADEPLPQLEFNQTGSDLVFRWPYGAAGFFLESSTSLSPGSTWLNVTRPQEISGSQNVLTDAPAGETRFYRLRQP